MHEARAVRRGERVPELAEDLQHLRGGEGSAALQGVAEVLSAEVLHDDPRDALVVEACGEHLHHVVAVDAGAGAGLLEEALPAPRVSEQPGVHDLEHPVGAGGELGHAVEGAHASAGDLLLDAVVRRHDGAGVER